MKKLLSFFLLLCLIFCALPDITTLEAASVPKISAASAILYDPVNGKILYAKNIYTKRPVASVTKLMTAMVVLDNLKLQKKVTVSKRASLAQPSKVYLAAGEQYSVEDLLHALLLKSGNDVAVCLAEAVGGSEWGFVQKMNAKARHIGLRNTRYINASGLPGKGQYSTVYDQARLMEHAMKYPSIRKIMARKHYTMKRPNGKRISLRNHNKLLWNYSKNVVGKTGFTRAAGRCYIGYAKHGYRRVIVCVLNSPKMWTESKSLLDYTLGKDSQQVISVNRKIHGKKGTLQIQRALGRSGYNPGRIDGIFGYKTLRAVYQFQESAGLKVDGIVGSQTMGKLRRFM
jgi:serine-type D-Ala-D-Ala carboxypeptidase (penicillin-binding protein 5/6)